MVQKLNNVAAGAVMDEQELDFVSGGSRAESKEFIKAKTGALDNNVYREATTGRFIRHEELCYWVKNGCKSDAKFKPWLNSDD